MEFEWDPVKARRNEEKHGVLFEDAVLVFEDPNALFLQDRIDEETGEPRWQVVGIASGVAILLVAHTIRSHGETEVIRIISARKASRKERIQYGQDQAGS